MKPIRINERITNRESKSVDRYLKELAMLPQFKDADEEFECATLAATGDKKALDLLVKCNMRFVVSVAKQYERKNINLEDLINQGNIGLIEAAKRFDTSKGNKFITHAVWWIRKEILDYIFTHGRTVRVPHNKIISYGDLLKSIAKMEQDLYTEGKNVPDYAMDLLNSKGSDVGPGSFSIDKPIDETGNSISDLLSGDDLYSDSLVFNEGSNLLFKLVDELKDKEKTALLMHFGIGYDYPMGLTEIGRRIGFSNERVRQLNKSSIKKLQTMANNFGVENFNL
jgi:RNA polymerase primary sigma factor